MEPIALPNQTKLFAVAVDSLGTRTRQRDRDSLLRVTKLTLQLLAGCCSLLGVDPKARAEDACEMVQIDPQGAYSVRLQGINNWGQVIGSRSFANPSRLEGFVWHHGHTRALPGFEQGSSGTPMAINDLGQIVGYSWQNGELVAVLWANGGTTITSLPGGLRAFPSDINNRGQIIGSRPTLSGGDTCLLWPTSHSEPTTMEGSSGTSCAPRAINDHGEIVGTIDPGMQHGHGFVWREGVFTDVELYDPNDGTRPIYTELMDINNSGLAVGFADVSVNYTELQTVLWTRQKGLRLLPLIAGSQNVDAWGTIFATSYDPTHLYLANARGHARDKGTLGPLVSGFDVWANDRLQVAWTAPRMGGPAFTYYSDAFFCQLR